ncbi:hypothetical protein A1O1_09199 [Capronia coronata CBS 617.96]|uniref:Acyltransferase 3 domain-containing protein n=1 Tax=Capronia coronata CBS 617.96 TaxID=1182541 RepID=W9XEA8_9EURO|nr:uncharacterized protein A1O1_09199 [Capronia coronata CBS 617.96]EXJ78797.1 hypothetical protein A1O1_09199 [Capronia coronata CBS 617.96]
MSPPYEGILEKGVCTDIIDLGRPAEESDHPPIQQPFKWLAATAKQSFSGKQNGRNTKLHRTAYLDGLRGFASLLVYCLHHQLWNHSGLALESAFGFDGHYYLACLPIVRIFFTGGHLAVSIFFVISGYVLSAKPLALSHSGDYNKLAENVGSALFRRWLRLYIPVVGVTFVVAMMPHVFGIQANFSPEQTWRDELWKWYCDFKNVSFVWRLGGVPWLSYHFHSWSIPYEFRGSITIYTAVMAFSRCTKTARLCCEVGLIIYFLYIADGALFAMFTAGMLLGDLDQLAERQQLPQWMSSLKRFQSHIFHVLFVLGLVLGGCPTHVDDIQFLKDSPGWGHFAFLVPQAVYDYKWFFLFWASVFTVASIPRIPWLKSFFEGRFCQYLGRISFALYMVHGPVLWTLGIRLYAATGLAQDWQIPEVPGWVDRVRLPHIGPMGLELNFLVPNLILLPVTLWLAEIGTTLLDEPSIKVSRWLYEKATGVGEAMQEREGKATDRTLSKR